MCDTQETAWKEVVVAYFNILSQDMTKENNENQV
jgi:hypothetical protein